MKKKPLFGIILVAFIACGISPASGQVSYFSRRVVGHVKDLRGRPVAGAKVCANPRSGLAGKVPCTVSNAGGRFALDVWSPDLYYISAEHFKEGYPEANDAFYGSFFGESPAITVTEASELRPVEVRFGPKAGRVVLKMVDDETGRPVERGVVEVCRADKQKWCSSWSTEFPGGVYEFLAPEVPFTLNKLQVWGVNGWEDREAVDGANTRVELLQVEPGARKTVMIRLRRPQAGG